MSTAEKQNSIIRKVLKTNDTELLEYVNIILNQHKEQVIYKLSSQEKNLLNESMELYSSGKIIAGNEVIANNKKWLEK